MSPADTSNIRSKEEFLGFLRLLRNDLDQHASGWSNADITSYLAALEAWMQDSDGYYLNRGEDPVNIPAWRRFADALAAARNYE